MQLSFQIVAQGTEDFLSAELGSDATISDLKMYLIGSVDLPSGYPEHTWILNRDNAPVTASDNSTLAAAGFRDGDLIVALAQPHMSTGQARRPGPPSAIGALPSSKLEELRQHILRHAPTRAAVEAQAGRELTEDGEDLNAVLSDPKLFKERWSAMEDKSRAEAERRQLVEQRLDDDVNEENQKAILKRIQQQQVQEEHGKIMEENPEFFASVTMLYVKVKVNGHPVKAFVDSGAQMTVISPDKAEECGLTRHIDERYSGIARGVGTARILGRVHRTGLTIEDANGYTEELPCSFTVMEGKGVDMLLGLDMLKRYSASIDLKSNNLIFSNGARLPFLSDGEIPKGEFDSDGQATAGSSSVGSNPPPFAQPPSADISKPGPSNFSGAGHTLRGGNSRPTDPSPLPTAGSSSTSSATVARPPLGSVPARSVAAQRSEQQAAGSEDQQKIDMLMDSGASSRDQARQLLEAVGGNLEMALSVLFDA